MIQIKELLKNEYARLALTLIVGITIGVVFYPSKRIEERVSQKYEQEIATLKEQHVKESSESEAKWTAIVNEAKSLKIEAEKKVVKLTQEVKTLQSKQKTAYYKIIRPDGTIEIKKFSESEVNESTKVVTQIQEEFKTKIEQIETKWSKIHEERVSKLKKEFDSKEQQYQKTIASYEASKVTTINEKKFGVEVGYLSNKSYYGHATMDVWGPTFIGVHGEMNQERNDNKLGIGVGLRF